MQSIFHVMCTQNIIILSLVTITLRKKPLSPYRWMTLTAPSHQPFFLSKKGENCPSAPPPPFSLSFFFCPLDIWIVQAHRCVCFPPLQHQINVRSCEFTFDNIVQSMTLPAQHARLRRDVDFLSASSLFTVYMMFKYLLSVTHITALSPLSFRRCLQPVNCGNQYTGLSQPRPLTTNRCCSWWPELNGILGR